MSAYSDNPEKRRVKEVVRMHNLALAVILADQRRRQCQCGAVADRPVGLCRKCQDRNAWRRKTTTPRRKTGRRGFARRVDDAARFLAGAVTVLTVNSNETGG
jgi:hypothetical protein